MHNYESFAFFLTYSLSSGILDVRKLLNLQMKIGLGTGMETVSSEDM